MGLSYRMLLCTNTLRIFNFLHPIKNTKNRIICHYYYYYYYYYYYHVIIIIVITVNLEVRQLRSVHKTVMSPVFCMSVKFGLSLFRLASHSTGTGVLSWRKSGRCVMLTADIHYFQGLRNGALLLFPLYAFMTRTRRTLTQLAADGKKSDN
jgi:hypothetical protein